MNIPKRIAKKIKKLGNLIPILFQSKWVDRGREREKKNLVPGSVPTLAGLPFPKNTAKIFKKLENIILTQFLYKLG